MLNRFIFTCIFVLLGTSFLLFLFKPIFLSDSIIIKYGLQPFDICINHPLAWKYIKIIFVITCILSFIVYANVIFTIFSKFSSYLNSKKHKKKNLNKNSIVNTSDLNLLVGCNSSNEQVFLTEKSLYQNVLITGTIGTGKTSSAMYPFTEQLISYKCDNHADKLGLLILDVKGVFFSEVIKYCEKHNRLKDLIIIKVGGIFKYNPLDKPDSKPAILANRLKTILTLFSKNNSESYWLDKVEQILTECIKLCRLYNDGYVTFDEIHKLVTIPDYYNNKIKILRSKFQKGIFSNNEVFDLLSSIKFFEDEFKHLDVRTLAILKSEITRITGHFTNDYEILNTFCPEQNNLNFKGFKEVIDDGKIVVLDMNIAEYSILSKIIATYLKLDFQTEIMSRLSKTNLSDRTCAFICDEFQEYITSTDANFFAQSREAKCINIVATQSYSSLRNAIGDDVTSKVIIQNLINKLWFRTDDISTIEEIQKQIGKEDKEKISKSISENAKETHFSYLISAFNSKDSNISESINSYIYNDFVYDTKFFTQDLEIFSCIAFLSDGNQILKPEKLLLNPHFYNN